MRDNKLFALFGLVLLIVAGLWLAIAPEVFATSSDTTYRTILLDQSPSLEAHDDAKNEVRATDTAQEKVPVWACDWEALP
jgi:hypothetical protein